MMSLLRSNILLLVIGSALLLLTCHAVPNRQTDDKPISHKIWTNLLQKHVNKKGEVDYKGFQADSMQLNQYLDEITAVYPNKTHWSKNQRLAYWINAYNAFTVQLVMRHYPIESIKDIGPDLAITFVNTVWDIKFIEIKGEQYDLNNIEHGIIRKKFDEPRIHFAVNCGSVSCPKLRREAYVAEKLDQQLDEQARSFINDTTRNKISPEHIKISKIFRWFKGDFTENGTLIEFLNQYSTITIHEDAEIDYLGYSWQLNDTGSRP